MIDTRGSCVKRTRWLHQTTPVRPAWSTHTMPRRGIPYQLLSPSLSHSLSASLTMISISGMKAAPPKKKFILTRKPHTFAERNRIRNHIVYKMMKRDKRKEKEKRYLRVHNYCCWKRKAEVPSFAFDKGLIMCGFLGVIECEKV